MRLGQVRLKAECLPKARLRLGHKARGHLAGRLVKELLRAAKFSLHGISP
jgi:hypothetical protein